MAFTKKVKTVHYAMHFQTFFQCFNVLVKFVNKKLLLGINSLF